MATEWPGIAGPLVADADVIQLGERENRDDDFPWPDVNNTAINRIDVFEAIRVGPKAVAGRIREVLARKPNQGYWIHLDIDVLDQTVMPAVDSPGSPVIPPNDLLIIIASFVANPLCKGMTVTVFDPDLDPDGCLASSVMNLLVQLPFPR